MTEMLDRWLVWHCDLTMIRERRDIRLLAWERVLTEDDQAPESGMMCQ